MTVYYKYFSNSIHDKSKGIYKENRPEERITAAKTKLQELDS